MAPHDDHIPARRLKTQQRVVSELGALGFALPGSLMKRGTRCGNEGCACRGDPPQLHGPYWLWTRKVSGKTVTKMLSDEQAERYKPWFENGRKLRKLAAELNELSIETIATVEQWQKGENRRKAAR